MLFTWALSSHIAPGHERINIRSRVRVRVRISYIMCVWCVCVSGGKFHILRRDFLDAASISYWMKPPYQWNRKCAARKEIHLRMWMCENKCGPFRNSCVLNLSRICFFFNVVEYAERLRCDLGIMDMKGDFV